MSSKKTLIIEKPTKNETVPFDLLELADPSVAMIQTYLNQGTCYLAKLNSEIVGVVILYELNPDSIEIKNIAIKETYQGNGYGKELIRFVIESCKREGFEKLIICTGNSSIHQLALYQKLGFEIRGIEEDFFIKNYNSPIFENGIQCKHKIILEKSLFEEDRQ